MSMVLERRSVTRKYHLVLVLVLVLVLGRYGERKRGNEDEHE
ncbi:MAG: hypothetical protein ABI217_04720 [Chthoniobacterales bacterium]